MPYIYKNEHEEFLSVFSEAFEKKIMTEGIQEFYDSQYKAKFEALKLTYEDYLKILQLDPTYKDGFDRKGDYARWLIELYLRGDKEARDTLVGEDSGKVKALLKKFNNLKRKKKIDVQIDSIKTVPQLFDVLKSFPDEEAKTKTDIKDSEIETVFDSDGWTVKVPKTYKASCILGTKTNWCTASSEGNQMFDRYNSKGKLYVISNGTDKWQFHLETNSFMDASDSKIDFLKFALENKIPVSLRKFLYELNPTRMRAFNPEFDYSKIKIAPKGNLTYIINPSGKAEIFGTIFL